MSEPSKHHLVHHALIAVAACLVWAGSAAGQTAAPMLFDPQMSVMPGATVAAGVADAAAHAEDAAIPPRLVTERGVPRRTGNIAYRVLKFALFDLPQEQWIMVANHEVFGHGARLRERFDGPIGYHLDAPAPYGPGGGSTSFAFDRPPTQYDLLTISAAGMEADAVAARAIARRAFVDRRMRVRDAMRYLAFELDTFGYVLSTDEDESPGHDVLRFIQDYNRLAAGTAARRLTPRTLRREVLIALANPMLGYAVFGIGRYLAIGDGRVGVPAPSIGGVRFLPMFRYQLAPYGTEWSLTIELAGSTAAPPRLAPTEIELRMARAPGGTPWGIGVQQRDVIRVRAWRVDFGLDLWRQPDVATREVDISPATHALHIGGALRVRGERPFTRLPISSVATTLIIDVAVKTGGFVPGEPLRSGVVARAGLGFLFDR